MTTETKESWRTIRFEVLEKTEKLPSLSNVVAEFLALARKEYFTAKDFEAVISKDQALVARLLKVANSGLYGRSRSINAIPEAVVLIGLENLKKIVYSVSSEGLMRRDLNAYDYHNEQGFWLHAMAVANASRVIAEASTTCTLRGEEAFVAGLLHDVAKLVVADFLPEGRREVSLELETETVGLNHAELAGYILRQWNLPESITNAVTYHHDYPQCRQECPEAAVLTLAQGICGTWGVGRKKPVDLSDDVSAEQFEQTCGDLGVTGQKWDQVIWDIRQSLVGLDSVYD